MATGDVQDMAARLRAVLPQGWFPPKEDNATPVLDGVLTGFAWPWAVLYNIMAYAGQQSRLQTSTGSFVDAASEDYLGDSLPRESGESDAAFITRIQKELVAPRNTRTALTARVASVAPQAMVFEPWRAPDSACFGRDGYGSTGRRYGSRTSPASVFVDAPAGTDETALVTAINDTKAEGIDVFYRVGPSAS